MGRQPTLEQWTDRALRQCLKLLEDKNGFIGGRDQCVMRGQLRNLLKHRRRRMIRNHRIGLVND